MLINKFEKRYTYIRNLKKFELEKYVQNFKASPIFLVHSFDDPNDQFGTLNKLILNAINEHAPLMKFKFTRPLATWMKDFEINKLQKERDQCRHETHSKHFNHGENPDQLGTKSKRLSTKKRQVSNKNCFNQKTKIIYGKSYKVIHHILSPNPKTLKVDPEKLHEFFNKTPERLVEKRKTVNATLRSYISSLKDKSNSLQLGLVTPTELNKCSKTLRNDCFTGYYNILVSFTKPVAEYLESPFTYHQKLYSNISIPRYMENHSH